MLEIEFPELSGIYKILNTLNGKFYIGSAVNFKMRFRVHKNELNRNCHTNRHLQFAWNKYGSGIFKFEIIEYCEKEKLLEHEQYWIDLTNCCDDKIGYNLSPVAGSQLGFKHSEETKSKYKIIRSNVSLEIREKISKTHTGMKRSPAHIKNAANAKIGFKHSKEAKAKIGLANSISLIGNIHSEETKLKMSVSRKNYLFSKKYAGNTQWL